MILLGWFSGAYIKCKWDTSWSVQHVLQDKTWRAFLLRRVAKPRSQIAVESFFKPSINSQSNVNAIKQNVNSPTNISTCEHQSLFICHTSSITQQNMIWQKLLFAMRGATSKPNRHSLWITAHVAGIVSTPPRPHKQPRAFFSLSTCEVKYAGKSSENRFLRK